MKRAILDVLYSAAFAGLLLLVLRVRHHRQEGTTRRLAEAPAEGADPLQGRDPPWAAAPCIRVRQLGMQVGVLPRVTQSRTFGGVAPRQVAAGQPAPQDPGVVPAFDDVDEDALAVIDQAGGFMTPATSSDVERALHAVSADPEPWRAGGFGEWSVVGAAGDRPLRMR